MKLPACKQNEEKGKDSVWTILTYSHYGHYFARILRAPQRSFEISSGTSKRLRKNLRELQGNLGKIFLNYKEASGKLFLTIKKLGKNLFELKISFGKIFVNYKEAWEKSSRTSMKLGKNFRKLYRGFGKIFVNFKKLRKKSS